MNTTAICDHLLPAISTYLQNHSDAVVHYARNTVDFSRLKKINKAFKNNSKSHETGLFGQTLWAMVMMRNLISDAIAENNRFPSGITHIIIDYLTENLLVDIEMQIDPHASTIKILSTLMKENNKDCFSTDLHLTVEPKSSQESTVKAIANLLQGIAPVSVRDLKDLGDVKESTTAGDAKKSVVTAETKEYVITGPNNLWINPQFIKALKGTQKKFSQTYLNALASPPLGSSC